MLKWAHLDSFPRRIVTFIGPSAGPNGEIFMWAFAKRNIGGWPNKKPAII